MKKLLLGLILCAGLLSCNRIERAAEATNDGYTKVVEIEGHKYIVARTYGLDKGGICIIHAESCECKKENNNDER